MSYQHRRPPSREIEIAACQAIQDRQPIAGNRAQRRHSGRTKGLSSALRREDTRIRADTLAVTQAGAL